MPVVIAAAFLTFGVWIAFGPQPSFPFALMAAVSVLIIACPCALGLATPMSIMVGVARGARVGVLIRNAQALERLERVDTLVVDKPGTLTAGKPAVVAVLPAACQDVADLVRLAAGLEIRSAHPLALAVVAEARRRNLRIPEPASFDSTPGMGVEGVIEGRCVLVGQERFLQERGVAIGALTGQAQSLRADGATVVFVALDKLPAGVFGIADPVKESAGAALEDLRRQGLRIVMLTGDSRTSAEAVARQLGIDAVEAEVLPQDKAEMVSRLRAAGRVVAMIGDGVNDAPALARADVGVAMGAGADVAIESAGLTLLTGDLRGVVRARALSIATMRNVPQNPVLCLHLQYSRHPGRSWRALSIHRPPAFSDHCRGRDGPVISLCDRQRAQAVPGQAWLMSAVPAGSGSMPQSVAVPGRVCWRSVYRLNCHGVAAPKMLAPAAQCAARRASGRVQCWVQQAAPVADMA